MPKRPKVELDPRLVQETISHFRYHRPPIEGDLLADPDITTIPYYPYSFEEAAYDVLNTEGINVRGNIILMNQLASAAKNQVPNADEIIERRQKVANKLNELFRLEHGID